MTKERDSEVHSSGLLDSRSFSFPSRWAIVFVCLVSLTVTPLTTLAARSDAIAGSSTVSPVLVFTDWRQQAQVYNAAMQLIAQAASLPIRNQSDLARAVSTLQKNGPLIEHGRVSAAIKTAADNVSFQSSVKAALATKCGGVRSVNSLVSCVSSFINQTAKDRTTFNQAGGSIGLSAIQNRFKNDSDLLRRLGTNMNAAIKNLRPANAKSSEWGKEREPRVDSHHVTRRSAELRSFPLTVNNTTLPQTGIVEIPIAIATAVCVAGGALTGGTGWAACAAGAVIVAVTVIAVAWAALKSEDFFVGKTRQVFRTNPDTGEVVQTEETKTDFEVCKEKADGSRESCLTSTGNNFWLVSGCWTVWTLRMADCLLLPQ
jgi:hypothetical protein